jgi:hypothetical protein
MNGNIALGLMLLLAFAALSSGQSFAQAVSNDTMAITITNVNSTATSPERENLNQEWVEIENKGPSAQNMDGWTLSDEGNHTYTFKGFTLGAGQSFKVHSGQGEDTVADLYWKGNNPIWNNDGDVATLKDASGSVISKYSYPKGK